jgi:solute:Na+ symporter, SSS family
MTLALMNFTWIDMLVIVVFFGVVMAVSLYVGRKKQTSEDYFLAGRTLTWPLIGFSLLAANISTEHFVGMSGAAFGRVGLAIASWEWTGVVIMVFVAWWFLPRFLKAGIYTMPEFLEYRYSPGARTIMAIYLMIAYVIVLLATVLYSGAIALSAIFDLPAIFVNKFGVTPGKAEFWAIVTGIWIIGIFGGIYTIYGGLKSVAWADLFQGAAIVVCGAIVPVVGLTVIGDGSFIEGWRIFGHKSADKLHLVLPWNDPDVPWLGIFTGLWVGHFFYWGLNQFITQRTLGAKSLLQGQKGLLFAAGLKLLIPLIIVLPGIMAHQLYAAQISRADNAYPYLISHILPPHVRGLLFAALGGAVMSTFSSGVNSASTIFTIDLYRKYFNPHVSEHRQVTIGRIVTAIIVVISCSWAPIISKFQGVFFYIQEIWGFILPGIVAVFFVGLLVPKATAFGAKGAMLLNLPLYGLCRFGKPIWNISLIREDWPKLRTVMNTFHSWSFLHHWGLVCLILVVFMLIVTAIKPLKQPVTLPIVETIDTTVHREVYVLGGLVIAAVVMLFFLFW